MRTEIRLFIAAWVGLIAQSAEARCHAELQTPAEVRFPGADGRGYDSFAGAIYASTFTISIVNQSDDRCALLLSFQAQPGLKLLENASGGQLRYAIGQNGQHDDIVDTDFVGAAPPHAIRIVVGPGAHLNRSFNFSIPAGQIQPSGAYGDTLLARLIDADDLGIAAEGSIRFQTRVTQQASILVTSGDFRQAVHAGLGDHRGTIDFGDLHSNETASIDLTILSNDAYDVRFESDHHGALWHDVDGAASKIPYAATFDGRTLNLAGGQTLLKGYLATDRNGLSLPLQVRIGQVGNARAGHYADRIVVTVLPDA